MSIIGHGDIASAIIDREGLTFFCSGVSNSRETRESEYQREENLLMTQDRNQHLIYFSSLCIFYVDNRYAQHKMHMEDLVKRYFEHYTIMRIGNIDWGVNPNTLINYFRGKSKEGEPFEVQDTYRYVVDKDEFQYWVDMIPSWNCEMNVVGRRMKVSEIVKEYV